MARLPKKKTESTAQKKREYIKILETKAGNISETCKAVNIHRATYYKWIEKDEKFAANVEAVNESLVDWVESHLKARIRAGDTTAIIFFLKCKAKERGYIDRQYLHTTHYDGGVLAVPVAPEDWEAVYGGNQSHAPSK